MALYVLKCR